MEDLRKQRETLEKQMSDLQQQEEEAARQAAAASAGESAQAAIARAEEGQQRAAFFQAENETLRAQIHSVDIEVTRLQQTNAAQAEERDALFTEVAQINAILISIAAATAENVAAVEQLARNADVLGQKGTEQLNLLQPVLTRLARFEAARTSAPQNVEHQTVDMAPARTTGIAVCDSFSMLR